MAIIEYEDEIKELVNRDNHDGFIYDFLSIYDKISKATITKLRKGTNNLAKNPGEVYLKNKLYFKYTGNDVLGAFSQVEDYVGKISSKPRYIIVTDYARLLAKDTKTNDSLDIEFTQLPKYFEFFLAWNGIEKADFEKENPADIKAAEYFARIYDQLLEDNEDVSRHGFNLFLIRLLFCLFAEDTGIFKENSFTDFLKMMTSDDGSDMNKRISELFTFLDKKVRNGDEPAYLLEFPYVNGQLFTDPHEKIVFSKKTRKSIIDAGELIGWSKVNPDILGSMLQAVATENKRSHLGMHYTSVPNIMKVIKPLFLNDLRKEFESSKGNEGKLNSLYNRIGKIKFMDPACGSGNFLIITYKELRQLEIDIINELNRMGIATMYIPSVTLDQFYGIEIDDFACDVTRLSLWIAEHQMNKKLEVEIHNAVRPTLPLQKAGAIVHDNALKISWESVLPHKKDDEVYLFGNPPYRGGKAQDPSLKKTTEHILGHINGWKNMDYISCWFILGAQYINESIAKLSFVSTNSICQGEQVAMLWPEVFKYSEINFAYRSFKWENNAKKNAAVIVVIIGLTSKIVKTRKKIIDYNRIEDVENISAYLTGGETPIVYKRQVPLSDIPRMDLGNMPKDGGNLILTEDEKNDLIQSDINSKKFIRRFIGSGDFIKGIKRYCLWIDDGDLEEAKNSDFINKRIELTRKFRLESKAKSTRDSANISYKFKQRGKYDIACKTKSSNLFTIIIPRVSSINRSYVPIGIVERNNIISDSAMAIYNAPIWLFGMLESKMHMCWLNRVGGKLKNDYRYSNVLVYNTFPIPKISQLNKKKLEDLSLDILDIREEEGGNLSKLYGSPLSRGRAVPMNEKLLNAHKKLDDFVDSLYKNKTFSNDNERLSALLDMYSKKIKGEK